MKYLNCGGKLLCSCGSGSRTIATRDFSARVIIIQLICAPNVNQSIESHIIPSCNAENRYSALKSNDDAGNTMSIREFIGICVTLFALVTQKKSSGELCSRNFLCNSSLITT